MTAAVAYSVWSERDVARLVREQRALVLSVEQRHEAGVDTTIGLRAPNTTALFATIGAFVR